MFMILKENKHKIFQQEQLKHQFIPSSSVLLDKEQLQLSRHHNKVFIQNLPETITESDLRHALRGFSTEILEVQIFGTQVPAYLNASIHNPNNPSINDISSALGGDDIFVDDTNTLAAAKMKDDLSANTVYGDDLFEDEDDDVDADVDAEEDEEWELLLAGDGNSDTNRNGTNITDIIRVNSSEGIMDNPHPHPHAIASKTRGVDAFLHDYLITQEQEGSELTLLTAATEMNALNAQAANVLETNQNSITKARNPLITFSSIDNTLSSKTNESVSVSKISDPLTLHSNQIERKKNVGKMLWKV